MRPERGPRDDGPDRRPAARPGGADSPSPASPPAVPLAVPTAIPRALAAALVVVVAEAAGLVAAGAALLVEVLRGGSQSQGAAVGLSVLSLTLAAALLVACRSVLRRSRGGRGFILTWQLLQGATALTVLQASGQAAPWVGRSAGAAVAGALAVVVLLLLPHVTAVTAPGSQG